MGYRMGRRERAAGIRVQEVVRAIRRDVRARRGAAATASAYPSAYTAKAARPRPAGRRWWSRSRTRCRWWCTGGRVRAALPLEAGSEIVIGEFGMGRGEVHVIGGRAAVDRLEVPIGQREALCISPIDGRRGAIREREVATSGTAGAAARGPMLPGREAIHRAAVNLFQLAGLGWSGSTARLELSSSVIGRFALRSTAGAASQQPLPTLQSRLEPAAAWQ